jgi:hypothetical protein
MGGMEYTSAKNILQIQYYLSQLKAMNINYLRLYRDLGCEEWIGSVSGRRIKRFVMHVAHIYYVTYCLHDVYAGYAKYTYNTSLNDYYTALRNRER